MNEPQARYSTRVCMELSKMSQNDSHVISLTVVARRILPDINDAVAKKIATVFHFHGEHILSYSFFGCVVYFLFSINLFSNVAVFAWSKLNISLQLNFHYTVFCNNVEASVVYHFVAVMISVSLRQC